jgi:hypothetical protein
MILGEPSVMREIEARHPGFAERYQRLQGEYRQLSNQFEVSQRLEAARTEAESALQRLAPTQPPNYEPRSYQSVAPQAPSVEYRDDNYYRPATIGRDPSYDNTAR